MTTFVIDPPTLQDHSTLRIEENSVNVPIDLGRHLVAFPEPVFMWNKNGNSLSGPSLTYSSITFSTIRRADAGNYMVSATNYILGSMTEQVGNDTASFYLDVICRFCECNNER